MKTSNFIDKSTWGDGEWQHEPDKLQWTDSATGLPCLIVRTPLTGSLCGYVGITEEHPWFGIYHSVSVSKELDDSNSPDCLIDVHGGLTFSDSCQENDQEHGICHIPEPGQSDRVWWFGFDCSHSDDVCPACLARAYYLKPQEWQTYRNVEYVKQEVTSLAAQLTSVLPATS